VQVNVDLLRIIQLGLTFSDENGNLHERCTWQFHFTFDLSADIFAQDSIDLLRKVHAPRRQRPACPSPYPRSHGRPAAPPLHAAGRTLTRRVQAGVDFDKHQREGIDVEEFGGLMIVRSPPAPPPLSLSLSLAIFIPACFSWAGGVSHPGPWPVVHHPFSVQWSMNALLAPSAPAEPRGSSRAGFGADSV